MSDVCVYGKCGNMENSSRIDNFFEFGIEILKDFEKLTFG